jgi:hypothetical protein
MAMVDWKDTSDWLTRCDCPTVSIAGAEFTTVEHHHVHGCPALAVWKRGLR